MSFCEKHLTFSILLVIMDSRVDIMKEKPVERWQMINTSTGKIIKIARTLRGVTQEDLAKKTGISRQALIAIERGQSIPTDPTYQKLQAALNIDFTDPGVIAAAATLTGAGN